jgi:hypothetical protein
MAHPTLRRVDRIQNGLTTFEGEGFAVRRPFPVRGLEQIDPFLLLDEMGPMELGPGEAKGAPDHPHRGFETVTYLIAGSFEHRDSAGHAGRLSAGDVQWMTAGDGVVHSEMPSAELRRAGGRLHGFQLWVNLPRRDKRMKPRYQEIPAAEIPVAESADGKVRVRVLAGESLGARAVIDTRTPIMYLHVTVQPGGALVQPLPAGMRAFAWVFGGAGRFDESGRAAGEGQLVLYSDEGEAVRLAVAADAAAPLEALLLAGAPLGEPVARYGPFVMNSEAEILEAIEDYRSGRMGRIAAD